MMSYNYQEIRSSVFSERAVYDLLRTEHHVRRCIELSGAVTMEKAISELKGDSFEQMAIVDYLVEKKILREITQAGQVAGQYRIFVAGRSFKL